MKKNVLLTFLAILFSFAIAKGQDNLVINLVDNSSVTVVFSNIQKITFDSDNLLLKTTTATNSYPLDNIASITFIDEVSIKEFTETIDVHVFVNASGEVVVETPHQINQLTVFDITGRQVVLLGIILILPVTLGKKLMTLAPQVGVYLLKRNKKVC